MTLGNNGDTYSWIGYSTNSLRKVGSKNTMAPIPDINLFAFIIWPIYTRFSIAKTNLGMTNARRNRKAAFRTPMVVPLPVVKSTDDRPTYAKAQSTQTVIVNMDGIIGRDTRGIWYTE